jgi:nucleoside-diphosphate-sugar epimerase
MRIFITGTTGYIGNAVALAFRRAGHEVKGLIRSETKAKDLAKEEIRPVIGDISTPESFLLEANDSEVLIHCAFEYSSEGVQRDLDAIDAFLKIASTSEMPRTIIYTSGCWIYGNTDSKIVDEDTPVNPLNRVLWRPLHEAKVLQAASKKLRTLVIRPGCVYGGTKGLTTLWFSSLQNGFVEIAGDGKNHWAMIHKDDLAEAYLLAAEKEIPSTVLNVVDSTHYTVLEMAEAIASTSGIPKKIRPTTAQEAEKKHGSLSQGLLADQKLSNERVQRMLGWRPRHKGFIEEVDLYLAAWKASSKN